MHKTDLTGLVLSGVRHLVIPNVQRKGSSFRGHCEEQEEAFQCVRSHLRQSCALYPGREGGEAQDVTRTMNQSLIP